jgi:O-antigen ligase
VLVIAAALSTQFGQDSNLVGFAFGLMAFAAGFWRPDWTLRLVSLGLAGWLLLAPFATPLVLSNQSFVDAMPTSWAVRTGIWRYVCSHILEAPWLGHGLDASRAVTDRINVRGLDIRAVPLHPHSASLQIWYETGAVGAVLAASVLVVGGWSLARALGQNRPAAAAAAATLACLGLIANVSFGLWQEWWVATMFMAAALVGALAQRPGVG